MGLRIAIIEFPGTNCERETARSVLRAQMEPVPFRWNECHDRLQTFDGFILGGGFSYEDRSRSGVIAALDPILDALKEEGAKGKPILGICNGAQILVESGMVPGWEDYHLGAALAQNKQLVNGNVVGTGYYNAWVHVKPAAASSCPFAKFLMPHQVMRMVAAHAQGRFVIPRRLVEEMERRGTVVLQYCDNHGVIDESFPVNPNGSVHNIAAVSNWQGNVLAIMPHPERTGEGDPIFHAMRRYLERRQKTSLGKIPEVPSFSAKKEREYRYQSHPHAHQLIVASIITDNSAISVEQALRKRGIAVSVKRAVHWELVPTVTVKKEDFLRDVQASYASGELFNSNKEFPDTSKPVLYARQFLVRPHEGEDFSGMRVRRVLTDWFGISTIAAVHSGVLWTFIPDTTEEHKAHETIEAALATHIICNPYSHRRYCYG